MSSQLHHPISLPSILKNTLFNKTQWTHTFCYSSPCTYNHHEYLWKINANHTWITRHCRASISFRDPLNPLRAKSGHPIRRPKPLLYLVVRWARNGNHNSAVASRLGWQLSGLRSDCFWIVYRFAAKRLVSRFAKIRWKIQQQYRWETVALNVLSGLLHVTLEMCPHISWSSPLSKR